MRLVGAKEQIENDLNEEGSEKIIAISALELELQEILCQLSPAEEEGGMAE